ncbi:MAG: 50S ribosomal protein L24e [Methanoregulaceae archaeon]|jgi:large subunit ribosomal protein L24e|nr:50S ribosomal protein L24e [Methanoregulaceae archaeon]
MVDQKNCSFCGEGIEPGTGKLFVRKDGSIFYFCSSKCENNFRLGRAPRRVAWTRAGRKAMGKE